MVRDFPFHGASEWEPGVWGSEISRLDKKFQGLDLRGEVLEAEVVEERRGSGQRKGRGRQ